MSSIDEINKILISLEFEDRKIFLQTHIKKLKSELKIMTTITSGISAIIKENKDKLKDVYKDASIFEKSLTENEKMRQLESCFSKYNSVHNEFINNQKVFINYLEELADDELYES